MPGITGLIYIPDYISQEHHDYLVDTIDGCEWDNTLKRLTQHYGYRYDYRNRSVSKESYLGPLPNWGERIAKRLNQDGLIEAVPDQVIVNQYMPGEGIGSHIDCEPCFGNKIFSLSIGSNAIMQFTHPEKERVELLLESRSLLMMTGEARYNWKHGIPARKADGTVKRERRISLTFRKVILEAGH